MKSHQKIDKAARDLSDEVHEANFVGAKMKSERRYTTLARDYPNPDNLREVAGDIKQHTLEHLDQY
jgi:L-lactate dehydrogenase complex protein LldF